MSVADVASMLLWRDVPRSTVRCVTGAPRPVYAAGHSGPHGYVDYDDLAPVWEVATSRRLTRDERREVCALMPEVYVQFRLLEERERA